MLIKTDYINSYIILKYLKKLNRMIYILLINIFNSYRKLYLFNLT